MDLILKSFVFTSKVLFFRMIFQKIGTYWKLGVWNLLRVAWYRLQVRYGIHKIRLPVGQSVAGPFFRGGATAVDIDLQCPEDALLLNKRQIRYFSNQLFPITDPPEWFLHPLTKAVFPGTGHWSNIGDFGQGDIKLIWELSRFQWLVLAAQGYITKQDQSFLSLMNRWLEDWSNENPVNQGPNWKCGQESSFRLINLMLAAFVLREHRNPTPAVIQIIKEHCRRIYPTLSYAVAQNNNHGTSEVTALFIAGAWMKLAGIESSESKRWLRRGRVGLEERIRKLVAKDGSFSQHSVNYHRLFLDTISLAEFWRSICDLPNFSENFSAQAVLATDWLFQVTDPTTGDAPNLGANDGAQLIQLADSDYRDFRPSVQLASVLFQKKRVYIKECDGVLRWLRIDVEKIPEAEINRCSKLFKDGGYATFIGGTCSGILRFPKFCFRPSHADLMHLEIMDRGIPIIRDGGTYSYNTGGKWLDYFPGIESHNTIQFDKSEPMPRLSRFLFGNWPTVESIEWKTDVRGTFWSGIYRDYLGRKHSRKVQLNERAWQIEDNVSGFSVCAVLRWRLIPTDWVLGDNKLVSEKARIIIETEGTNIERMELVEGWESCYYNEKTELPVLEIEIAHPGTLHSRIELPQI
jgi:hypothetical protein